MTEIANLRVPSLRMLMFYVKPSREMSKASRRRFFSAMRRALSAAGYVMTHCHGLCLVIPARRQAPRIGRDDVVRWLLDQVETSEVRVYRAVPISDLLAGRVVLVDEGGEPLGASMDAVAASFLLRATAGALLRTVTRLQMQDHDLRPHHAWRSGSEAGAARDRRLARSTVSDKWSPARIAQALATSFGRRST